LSNWDTAVVLGIVEGLTEFIPVSSTGHLIVAGNLLGFLGSKAATFEIAIQLGAILSVVILYYRRFLGLIPPGRRSVNPSSFEGWAGVTRVAVATLPALVAGYLAHTFVTTRLFTPGAVALALAVGGAGILVAERWVRGRSFRPLDRLTLFQAFGIGCFQVLSLWPGTSRSAATIIGGLLLGLDRKSAAEFSFLIAVPIMMAATGYDLLKSWPLFTPDDLIQLAIGFAVSFAVAIVSIAAFIRFLNRWTLAPFAWYRIAVAPLFYFITRGGGL
jgi:undecaprenyl-diphosphatase